MNWERRCVVGQVELRKAQDGSGPSIRGYGAVFNSRSHDLGGFVEEIAPGAFDEVLSGSEDVIATALDHEGIIGRRSSKTMRIGVDERGLWYEVDLPETQAARDLAALMERGDIRGSSFGFRVNAGEGDKLEKSGDTILRTITKVARLRDVGPVVNPAYEAAHVSLRALELAKAPDPRPFPEERLKRQIKALDI